MGNDLPLAGNLAGSKKPEETSFNSIVNLIMELSRYSARSKQQCKYYLTFKLIHAVVHSNPEPLQIKTI